MEVVRGVTGVSGEATELRGDHPFKVLGYFRRRGTGCLGTWQTLLFQTQAWKTFQKCQKSTFLPGVQLSSQLHR